MTVFARALPELLTDLGVKGVEILQSVRVDSFRGSSYSPEASAITARARQRHHADGFGFWNHVLMLGATAPHATRQALYQGAVRGNPLGERKTRLSTKEFRQALEEGRWLDQPGRQLTSLSSRVWLNTGEVRHLNLLDFGIPLEAPGALQAAESALDALQTCGLLVSSGRSMHLYGAVTSSWTEYVEFLARASLLSPIVDARWAAYSVLDGRGALRISTAAERDQQPPELIASDAWRRPPSQS